MIKVCCTITQFRLILCADLIKVYDRPVIKVGELQAWVFISVKQYRICMKIPLDGDRKRTAKTVYTHTRVCGKDAAHHPKYLKYS